MKLSDLPARWRGRADELRRYAPEVANAIDDVAVELEEAITEHELELLSLEQAVEESGLSYGHLQRLVAQRKIPNAGRRGSPRVQRKDLPRKAS